MYKSILSIWLKSPIPDPVEDFAMVEAVFKVLAALRRSPLCLCTFARSNWYFGCSLICKVFIYNNMSNQVRLLLRYFFTLKLQLSPLSKAFDAWSNSSCDKWICARSKCTPISEESGNHKKILFKLDLYTIFQIGNAYQFWLIGPTCQLHSSHPHSDICIEHLWKVHPYDSGKLSSLYPKLLQTV